jgi:hypothetical protein
MFAPFLVISQETKMVLKTYKINNASFFKSKNDPFVFNSFSGNKPLYKTTLLNSKGKIMNSYSFENKNLYGPNTFSVYQTSKFETPHIENLAAELFIGFLYELCRVIDNPQPLFCQ